MTYQNESLPEELEAFARRLKRFRKTHHLTQAEMAAALGLHTWTVGVLERCEERPMDRTILRLAHLEEKYAAAQEKEMDALEGMS